MCVCVCWCVDRCDEKDGWMSKTVLRYHSRVHASLHSLLTKLDFISLIFENGTLSARVSLVIIWQFFGNWSLRGTTSLCNV